MRVAKFGGTSMADAAQFEKVIAIIKADPERRIVVVSAPGKRTKTDVKVTDLLIQLAQAAEGKQAELMQAVLARFSQIAAHFDVTEQVMPQLTTWLTQAITKKGSAADRLARIKAQGERFCAYLLTAALNACALPASFGDPKQLGITVDGASNDASVNDATYAKLAQQPLPQAILVVPGFYGFTKNGDLATFSRGGSDITGAILARGYHASLYENFTDVDGVLSADPRVVKDPQIIATMTFREMRELSYGGFAVFHDEAILPVIAAKIPINIKNTNRPELPGTMIVPEQDFKPTHAVTGIVSSTHFTAIYLHRYLLNQAVGLTMHLLQILYRHGLSYEHMPSGIDDLTVILDAKQLDENKRQAVTQEIQAELQPDTLRWLDDYAITMVVGEGMAARTGLIQYMLQPLAAAGIHVMMLNEGASQISVMIGTSREQSAAAVRAIYNAFFIPINQRLEV